MLSEEKLKLRSCNITYCLIEVVIQAGLTLVHLVRSLVILLLPLFTSL